MSLPLMALCLGLPLWGQTHVSVSLENQAYYILEQAQARGLCRPLSGVKPYTQNVIITAIDEILRPDPAKAGSAKLKETERAILEQYLKKWAKPKTGMDWRRGAYYQETKVGKKDTVLSANAGINADIEGSAGLYSSFKDRYFGAEVWAQFFFNGDIGNYISYNASAGGGFFQSPRNNLGKYDTYYKDFVNVEGSQYQNLPITVYSEPLSHFPYTYKKRWDGSVHHLNDPTGADSWPDSASTGYHVLSELSASLLEDRLIFRMGRIAHEWGSSSLGSSLVLNQTARPFLGFEADFNPVSWLGFSTMTGILEFFNRDGEKKSAMTFQNAYSITMIQLKIKNYFFFDIGESVVWPKRFEFGYLFPLTPAIIYQFNLGDFDNMALFFNIKGQYPGIGNIWFSFFMDEINFSSDLSTLDRQMFSWQAGTSFSLPFLSFSSIKLSYTTIKPYCYTHNRNYNPWYGNNIPMETSYTNNGVGLGYYLPPNSDEVLVRFSTMPIKNITANLQYQMIRHGADFGLSAVDGSNYLSELDPKDRDNKKALKRFFLRDGAYQWMHVVKLGGEWSLEKAPLAFYWEAGTVISWFTNIKEEANVTGKPHSYAVVDTDAYPKSTGFIAKLGVRVFPR